jgi:type II secretory pathway component PulC
LRAIANLVAIGALAAVVAFWGWRWLGPVSEPLVRKPADDVAAALGVSPPFGASPASAGAPSAPSAPAPGDVRLLGVLAEPGGRGRALLRMPDGSARLASVGEALGAAGTLAGVHPDGVTLRGASGERRMPLRSPAATSVASQASARQASCIPAGYRGPVVRLNAELITGMIQQPQSLAAIVEAKDGALILRDESGFGGMLGLRKGDRVTQANGIALRAPEDVIVALLRPLAANQSVRISGLRGSEPQELLLVNAAACR